MSKDSNVGAFLRQKDGAREHDHDDDDDVSDDDSLDVTLASLYEAEDTNQDEKGTPSILKKRKDNPGGTSSE